jgi:L-ribulose-5-phosphate 3-epimerase
MKKITSSLFRLSLLSLLIGPMQCKTKPTVETPDQATSLNISLAQWSIHRALENGSLQAENFAAIAKNDFGITAVEYVNSFYKDHATDAAFWQLMKVKADSLGVKSLLIMVDNEGDLGNPKEEERIIAVTNHHKWVDAAKILGCHSIRVNAFGDGSKGEVKAAMIASLAQLGAYAASKNMNVLIENHGLYSADGKWVADVITTVNLPNVGTLPDFGNWCTAAKWGSTEPSKDCKEAYDRYQGVADMLPFAKGVSAKSYQFDEQGNEKIIDYKRMLQIVKDSGFNGYIGVEYEGDFLSESDGIKATKNILEKTWVNLKP